MTEDLLLEPEDRFDPARQREVLGRLAEQLAARRLAVPAIFVLESTMPLTYVVSQTLVLLRPFVQGLLGLRDYAVFAAALEDRGNVEWLIQQLEATEEDAARARRAERGPQ